MSHESGSRSKAWVTQRRVPVVTEVLGFVGLSRSEARATENTRNRMTYLKIWEVLRHEAVDLADGQTSCFTVH